MKSFIKNIMKIDDIKINTKASDWCTGWWDKIGDYDYSACCQKHDDEYADPAYSRWEADVNLLNCVRTQGKWDSDAKINSSIKTLISYTWGTTMFIGVRTFGWMFKHYKPKAE